MNKYIKDLIDEFQIFRIDIIDYKVLSKFEIMNIIIIKFEVLNTSIIKRYFDNLKISKTKVIFIINRFIIILLIVNNNVNLYKIKIFK